MSLQKNKFSTTYWDENGRYQIYSEVLDELILESEPFSNVIVEMYRQLSDAYYQAHTFLDQFRLNYESLEKEMDKFIEQVHENYPDFFMKYVEYDDENMMGMKKPEKIITQDFLDKLEYIERS